MDSILNRLPNYLPLFRTQYEHYKRSWEVCCETNSDLCRATMLEF